MSEDTKKPDAPFDWDKLVEFVLAGIPQQPEQILSRRAQLERLIPFAKKLGLSKAADSMELDAYDD